MAKIYQQYKRQPVKKTRIGWLPIGYLIDRMSDLDEESKIGLCEANTLLKSEGILVLDAHRETFDILMSVALVTDHLTVSRIVFPVAAYLYYTPIMSRIVRGFDKLGIDVHSVYRKEERERNFHNMIYRQFYPKEMTEADIKEMNEKYLIKAEMALRTPHQAVVFTPFGGVKSFMNKVRHGVARLLASGSPVICSLSMRRSRRMRYVTYFSKKPFRFEPGELRSRMNARVRKEFEGLMNRAASDF